jgi:D-alanyl-D-alanine dipeptidase
MPLPGSVTLKAAALVTAGFVDAASTIPKLAVEMKYSTPDNFTGADVYGDFATCLLIPDAAAKLRKAVDTIAVRLPGATLLAYDCARPLAAQDALWAKVKGTAKESYVANPKNVSVHSYGCAVDVTVRDATGQPLDMGTPFDFFGAAAEPRHETTMLRDGKLSAAQVANRLLLRSVMVEAGFFPLMNEWWHFDCLTRDAIKAKGLKPLGGMP